MAVSNDGTELTHRSGVSAIGGVAAIGGTPVVRLSRLVDDTCAEVRVKLEGANPTAPTRTGWPWR